MKKSTFSSFFKSYSFLLCVLVAVIFMAMSIFSISGSRYAGMFQICMLGILGFISILGFIKMKSDEITSIDFLRFSALLGTIGSIIIVAVKKGFILGIIIPLIVIGVLLLITSIVRLVNGASEVSTSGLRAYTITLARKFNPIVLILIGTLIGSIASVFVWYHVNLNAAILNAYSAFLKPLLAIGCLLAVAMCLDKNSEASVVDAFLVILAVAGLSLFISSVAKDGAPYYQLFIIAASLVVIVVLRGVLYQGPKIRESKSMVVRYYIETSKKYEPVVPLIVGLGAAMFLVASTYGHTQISHILKSLLGINVDLVSISLFGFIVYIIAAVLPLVIQLIVRKIKSTEIVLFDYMTMISASVAAFYVPVVAGLYAMPGTKQAVMGNPLMLATLIIVLVCTVVAIILHIVRVRAYKFACYKVGVRPVKEKTPEEIAQEQQVKEIGKIEDLINIQNKPAVSRGVIKANTSNTVTYVDDDLNIVEAPQAEEAVEEVVYVDEDGNVVDAPEANEEVVEEVVYVDEEGNVIESTEEVAEEVAEEVTEEVVYVDEEGNVIEAPAEEVVEEVVYVDEEGNIVEAPEEEEDEDDEEEEIEEEIEEEVEEVAEEQPKEKDIVIQEAQLVDENGEAKKIKRKFNSKMMFAPYEAKEYYNEIKNYLVMYRAKGRNSSRCETFRNKGLVAKVALGGKSIKVFLAIDPKSLEGSKYHFKDCSNKKQYQDVPVMIKVRSQRGLKYFKELVDLMMAGRGVKPKKNFQPTNYLSQLIPNGEAILASFGLSTDYLYNSMNAIGIPSELPDDLIDYIPCIQLDPLAEEEVEATVYLDTLCSNFNDGDEVNIDILKSLHIVENGNVIRIKARGTLDKVLTIYAEYFDEDALKMLMCVNCTAIRIIR